MAELLRRLKSPASWQSSEHLQPDEVSADVACDLLTKDSSLSVWCYDPKDPSCIEDVALALLTTGNRIDRVFLARVEESALRDAGLTVRTSRGNSPVNDVNDKHADIVGLDLSRLALVGKLLADAVRMNRMEEVSQVRAGELLRKGLERRRFDLLRLQPELRRKLEAS